MVLPKVEKIIASFQKNKNGRMFYSTKQNVYYISSKNIANQILVAQNITSKEFDELHDNITNCKEEISDYINKNRDKIKNCCLTKDI